MYSQMIFHEGPFKTVTDVEYATAGRVDWYINCRLHGNLAMVSSNEYERTYYATLDRALLPV